MDKKCFKCGETKPIDQFYTHPQMADGHLGKCKECTKVDVNARARQKPERIAEYEHKRSQDQKRKDLKKKVLQEWRRSNPDRAKAHSAVAYAIKTGKITKEPCAVCGELKVEGHHEDYSKPLDVVWLCCKHHHALSRTR